MEPFILNNALHIERNSDHPKLFLDWLSLQQIGNPEIHAIVVATIFQPENNIPIYFIRLRNGSNEEVLQGCMTFIKEKSIKR